jgi:hypothetical protein
MRKIARPEEEARFAELQASNMITPEQFKKYNICMEGEAVLVAIFRQSY